MQGDIKYYLVPGLVQVESVLGALMVEKDEIFTIRLPS